MSEDNAFEYPQKATAWTFVIFLTLAYILSYLDRSILGLLIEDIKGELRFEDGYVGILTGPAFGLFYATFGLPLGFLADRTHRTKIVGIGVLFWSFATIATGLAHDFTGLFIARMCVGIGEASLGPCALSIIGDSFSPKERGRPISIYSTSLSLGSGLAGLIGGNVLAWSKAGNTMDWPVLGELTAWRDTLIIVGLPGIIIGLIFLLLPEPSRQTKSNEGGNFGDVFQFVKSRYQIILGIFVLVSVSTIIAYSHTFLASAFFRKFELEPKDFGKINGTINLFVGPLSILLLGYLVDVLRKKGKNKIALQIHFASFISAIIFNGLGLLSPSKEIAFVVFAFGTAALAGITVTGIIALLDVIAPNFRGQVTGLYYMFISLSGLFLGPTSVGFLSSKVFGEQNLHFAVAIIPVIYGIIPLFLMPKIYQSYSSILSINQVKQNGQ